MRKVNIRGKEFNVTENQQLFWDQVEAGLWEPETFDVLDELIQPRKTFIDIGAWNGVCSIYANALGANVESVEPDKAIENTLISNLEANCNCHYFFWECAISDCDGESFLNSIGSFGDSMSSLITRNNNVLSKGVKSFTLENFIENTLVKPEDICLIKMDIEGGEVLVLPQAKEFLAKHKPTIYLSLHPGWFPHGKDDLRIIMEILFPVYKVCRMIDKVLVQYNQDNFLKAIERGEHSYILIAK